MYMMYHLLVWPLHCRMVCPASYSVITTLFRGTGGHWNDDTASLSLVLHGVLHGSMWALLGHQYMPWELLHLLRKPYSAINEWLANWAT